MTLNWDQAIIAAQRLGFSVLVRNMDPDILPPPIFHSVIIIQSPEQAAEVSARIDQPRASGVYYDPQNYLSPEVVGKMVVLG